MHQFGGKWGGLRGEFVPGSGKLSQQQTGKNHKNGSNLQHAHLHKSFINGTITAQPNDYGAVPVSGGAGYSGSFSLLASTRFTWSSSNSIDGLIMEFGIASARLDTFKSSPAATMSLRSDRVSSSPNNPPRTNSSCPSFTQTRRRTCGERSPPRLSTK